MCQLTWCKALNSCSFLGSTGERANMNWSRMGMGMSSKRCASSWGCKQDQLLGMEVEDGFTFWIGDITV